MAGTHASASEQRPFAKPSRKQATLLRRDTHAAAKRMALAQSSYNMIASRHHGERTTLRLQRCPGDFDGKGPPSTTRQHAAGIVGGAVGGHRHHDTHQYSAGFARGGHFCGTQRGARHGYNAKYGSIPDRPAGRKKAGKKTGDGERDTPAGRPSAAKRLMVTASWSW